MNLLIADDDVTICSGTVRRLGRMAVPGIDRVFSALSAEEALDIIGKNPIGVLLTDIRMGDMDGLTLIARAKALQPPLVCVIITAYGHFQYAQEAIRLGVDDYLVKPCGESAMRLCVDKAVAKVRADRPYWDQQLASQLEQGLAEPAFSLRACFFRCGRELPPSVRAAVWRPGTELPAPAGWRYDAGRFCLADEREKQALGDAGAPVAFSEPGDLLCGMYREACRRLADAPDNLSFLRQVDAYVDAHLYRDIDMAAVANELNLSYSYFSRQFRELRGDTFNHYLTLRRMQEACRLLRAGVHLADAADRLGYQNSANFIRAFRREYGLTPSQWLSQPPAGDGREGG